MTEYQQKVSSYTFEEKKKLLDGQNKINLVYKQQMRAQRDKFRDAYMEEAEEIKFKYQKIREDQLN